MASDQTLASQNINYYHDYNNSHNFVYLRKDLLDRYRTENDYALVWGIWGERQITFNDMVNGRDFHKESGLRDFPVFHEIEVYKH